MFLVDGPMPKISCLLVTADGRIEQFKRSFQCYVDQTYSNRELVIINDGSLEYQHQMQAVIGDRKDVYPIFLDGRYKLGGLRNISIEACRGDLFVQWDDDDFNMPQRLMTQYHRLSRTPNRFSYLGDQLHFYFPNQELYWESWYEFHSGGMIEYSLIPGTLMAYRADFPTRYPISAAGEDTVLAKELCQTNELQIVRGLGHLHVYSYHGKNVWDMDHHLHLSRTRSFDCDYLVRHRNRIEETLAYMNFPGPVRVMGREGLAYTY
jgi:glycosyltransferase involved in cell wall biosynthesis